MKTKIPKIVLNENEFHKLLEGFWVAGFVPPSPIAHGKMLRFYQTEFGEFSVNFILKVKRSKNK